MGDIFLNTTTVDNTPVSVVEAAANGLCIVSTDVGGIPHLLTHHHNALLVRPRDEHAMAQAVCEILATPRLAETISVNARQAALRFDWSVVLQQWQQLISSCSMEAGC